MDYELATEKDWPQIIEMVSEKHYVPEPYSLGGHWLVAKNGEKIYGTIWFFMEMPHVFIDYWTASHGRIAAKLMAKLQLICGEVGIKYLHATIHESDKGALRLAVQGFGGIDDGPYRRVFKEIPNGV